MTEPGAPSGGGDAPGRVRRRHVLRPSYASLLEAGSWRPIPGCPGRMVLRGSLRDAAPEDLVGAGVPVREFRVAAAPDPVRVAVVEGGGLISYRRPDGTYVHTLNTAEGLSRKLAQLGIEME